MATLRKAKPKDQVNSLDFTESFTAGFFSEVSLFC